MTQSRLRQHVRRRRAGAEANRTGSGTMRMADIDLGSRIFDPEYKGSRILARSNLGSLARTVEMLDHVAAMKAVDAIAAALTQRQKAAVVAVADSYGELVALLRIGEVPLSSIRIAMNKAWTAARERQATAEIGKASRDPRSGFDISYYGDTRYVGWGGGVPVWIDGRIIGAIGVSGLPDESDDVELAELGVAALRTNN